MWNNTPLNVTRFKTIDQIFSSIEEMLEDGVSVLPGWRLDDIQGVPDEMILLPAGKDYGFRVVVRMPKEFHLFRLDESKKAFAALGAKDYTFTFQRYGIIHKQCNTFEHHTIQVWMLDLSVYTILNLSAHE